MSLDFLLLQNHDTDKFSSLNLCLGRSLYVEMCVLERVRVCMLLQANDGAVLVIISAFSIRSLH